MESIEIPKGIYCDECDKMIPRQFRFTDWDEDRNDVLGNWVCCIECFNQAVSENPEGRYSIYAVTICNDCDSMLEDEGVYYNLDCPNYAVYLEKGFTDLEVVK